MHVMEACRGSGGIAPLIFNLGTRWMWVGSLAPSPLYPWYTGLQCPLNRRLGGEWSPSGHFGGKEKSHGPSGISVLDCPVSILTLLSWLLCK